MALSVAGPFAQAMDLHGRTALVTGATGGIGRETARLLAGRGARVILAVRDVEAGEALAKELGGRATAMRLDLARLADVRRFAQEYKARGLPLHILINNAGLHTAKREMTEDGNEVTLQVNHLGHFLLTRELEDALRASAPARVVNVASEAHRGGRLDFDDLHGERWWSGLRAYTQSKLANIEFTYELARRLDGTGVTANAVHPGSVRTGWARGAESGFFRLAVKISSPFLISPERAAEGVVRVAADPDLETVTGRYFAKGVEKRSAPWSYREADQRRLWEVSERLVGLAPTSRSGT